jgi:hypothetical protein
MREGVKNRWYNHLKIMLLTYLKICGITNILETDELVGCISSL